MSLGALCRIIGVHDASSGCVFEVEVALDTCRHWVALIVDNQRSERRQGSANTARMFEPFVTGDAACGADLGGAIGVEEDGPEPLDHPALDIDWTCCAGVGNELH